MWVQHLLSVTAVKGRDLLQRPCFCAQRPLTIHVGFRALFLKLRSGHGPPYLKICSIPPLFMKQIQKYFAQLSRLFVSWLSFNILSSFLLLLTSHPIYSRLIAPPKLANHSQLFMIFFHRPGDSSLSFRNPKQCPGDLEQFSSHKAFCFLSLCRVTLPDSALISTYIISCLLLCLALYCDVSSFPIQMKPCISWCQGLCLINVPSA